ncbi:hypothetical protein D3C85_1027610 [compost metagenome]
MRLVFCQPLLQADDLLLLLTVAQLRRLQRLAGGGVRLLLDRQCLAHLLQLLLANLGLRGGLRQLLATLHQLCSRLRRHCGNALVGLFVQAGGQPAD